MKKLIYTLGLIFSFTFCKSQSRDDIGVSIIYGYMSETGGFNMGMSLKNLIHQAGIGMYWLVQGTNQEYYHAGEDLFESAYGYHDEYSFEIEDFPRWGMSGGLTFNFGRLVKKENLGLTIYLGLGSSRHIKLQTTYVTRFYNNPYLDPESTYWVENCFDEKKLSYECFAEYDFLKEGMVSLALMGGYNRYNGIGVFATVGLRIPTPKD